MVLFNYVQDFASVLLSPNKILLLSAHYCYLFGRACVHICVYMCACVLMYTYVYAHIYKHYVTAVYI